MRMLLPAVAIAGFLAITPSMAQQSSPTASLPIETQRILKWSQMAPRDLFQSDEVLSASMAEIENLNLRSSEALAHGLADCESRLSENDEIRFQCDRSWGYFKIVTAPRGPLGLLAHAITGMAMLVRVSPRNGGTSSENGHLIERLVKIESRWSDGVLWRLETIDKERH
jgi:hypothetical protein